MGLSARINLTQKRPESQGDAGVFVPRQPCSVQNGELEFSIAHSVPDVLRLEDDWRDLERRCHEPFTFFQTFDWCAGWLQFQQCSQSAVQQPPRPTVVTVRISGKLTLVCPLMERRSVTGACGFVLIGEPHTQYSNILIDPGCDQERVLEAFWARICTLPGIDTLCFTAVPANSTFGVFLERVATRIDVPNETALMDFSIHEDWPHYQASLSCGLRRGRSKRRNKLGRAGKISFVVLWPDDQGFNTALHDAVRFKRDWLQHTGRISEGLAWLEFENFLLSIPGNAGEMEGLIVHALRLDGRNIAIELGFIRHGDYYCFLGGFDWTEKAFSPGKVQIESSFRWFLENGIQRYDFLPNPAAYKTGWTNAQVDVWSFSHHLTLRGWIAGVFTGPAMRQRVKTLYYRLPQSVRLVAGAAFRAR